MTIDTYTPQGHCPRCGAPIYTETIPTGHAGTKPVAVYTCECRHCLTPPNTTQSAPIPDKHADPLHPIETKCATCNSDRMTELRFHNKRVATFCRDCGEVVLR